MRLPTLYKLNNTNKISQWTMCVEDNYYWTEFGISGGTIQSSEKTYCYGKNKGKVNETSDEEQAIVEATSVWEKKQRKENFVTDPNEIKNKKFEPPMLAKKYDGVYKDKMKFIQPKLDGIRCNISWKDGVPQSISRNNVPFFSTLHITDELWEFFDNNPTVHLDGELYNHVLHDDFNKIVSLVRKQKLSEKDQAEIDKYLKYYIYDMWDDKKPDMQFSERSEFIKANLSGIKNIVVVPTFEIHNSDEIDDKFTEFVKEGYEGAIIRTDDPYEHKRSGNLLKYKKFNDEEFEILDVNIGKNQTIAESLTIRLHNGNICNSTLAFSDEECAEILKNKEHYIGMMATVCYFGITNDGMLRFPVVKAINRNSYE